MAETIIPSSFVSIYFELMNANLTSVCEVAACKYEDGVQVSQFERIVKPQGKILWNKFHREVLKHISDDDIDNAKTFAEIYPELQKFVGDDLVIFYKGEAGLDCLFYLQRKYNLPVLYKNGYIDACEISSDYYGSNFQGINNFRQKGNTHQAVDNATYCAKWLIYYCTRTNISYIDIGRRDYHEFIHYNEYTPRVDKQWDKKDFIDDFDITHIDIDVIKRQILYDDDKFSVFYLNNKKISVTGVEYFFRNRLIDTIFPGYGVKFNQSAPNSKTDAIIIGDHEPGHKMIISALKQKEKRPDSFFIFSEKVFMKKYGTDSNDQQTITNDLHSKSKWEIMLAILFVGIKILCVVSVVLPLMIVATLFGGPGGAKLIRELFRV